MKIIQERTTINKFFIKLRLDFYLRSVQIEHLTILLLTCLQIGFDGKMTEASNIYMNRKHRTSISRFFTSSTWNEDFILSALQKSVITRITENSRLTKKPIELIIDDTISKKAKPSSKAVNIIMNAQYHYSHTEGKQVYGHQIFVAILKCGKMELPYFMSVYNKEIASKISMAIKIISSLKGRIKIDTVLSDSWYSSEKVIKNTIEAKYTYIGALKINRVIYTKNESKGLQIKDFARSLKKSSFGLVTVKGKKYYTYRYCGKINGFKEVVIIITYPKGNFGDPSALKAFICSDTSKLESKILHIYTLRWPIETFIRDCKRHLGLDGYQIRNTIGVKRYLIAIMLTYCYIASRNKKRTFSQNLSSAKNNVKCNTVEYIYNSGKENIPLADVLKVFKAD